MKTSQFLSFISLLTATIASSLPPHTDDRQVDRSVSSASNIPQGDDIENLKWHNRTSLLGNSYRVGLPPGQESSEQPRKQSLTKRARKSMKVDWDVTPADQTDYDYTPVPYNMKAWCGITGYVIREKTGWNIYKYKLYLQFAVYPPPTGTYWFCDETGDCYRLLVSVLGFVMSERTLEYNSKAPKIQRVFFDRSIWA